MRDNIQTYLNDIKSLCEEISIEKIEAIAKVIHKAYLENKKIFIIGNGGSAATASHFACDLGKGAAVSEKERLKVISLADNISLISALANDYGYSSIFKEQLISLSEKGDILIAISASGNSKNIIDAVEYARTSGLIVVGFAGFDGGKLKETVDEIIIIPSFNYGQVEDMHLILEHVISQTIHNILKSGIYKK